MKLHNHEGPEAADEIERLRAERDEAISGRDTAIRYLAARAREAGSWQGIAEGKDIVIRQLEAERDRLRLEADGLLDGNLVIWAAYSRLRGALLEIAVMETGRANATVKRMAQKARDALGQGYP
jgi:hypothetical protein